MPPFAARLCLLGLLLLGGFKARAQDLYDPATLRSFAISFHDADWLARLRANYASETPILADLVVDGVTYPNVGVRIRGNTSYTALPAGSEKFSLKIDMDFVDANQELMGHDSLNLNNGFRDPTFMREVAFNNYAAQFVPNPRANHVLVSLNGQNWGVYINVQQPDKRMLRDYFSNADGLRIRCANNPNGPGLAYNGSAASGYTAYEIQNDGGLVDPVGSLINVANALSNAPLANWTAIDEVFAIDPAIWSVVLENLLTDDDSYINKGCDFMTYTDPLDGRMHLLTRDANETFTQTSWAITRNFTATNKPVLSRVLAVNELRQRYMAHYRSARANFSWNYFGPRFEAQRALIEAHVQADPKKLYSHALFQQNFSQTVTMPLGGLAGGNIIGLQPFITQRSTFLETSAELVARGPALSNAAASTQAPDASQRVWIGVDAAADGAAVSTVELFYRTAPSERFARVGMRDDGASGDGAAGDGRYGVLLPITATPGQRVDWYVGATANNTFGSASFVPVLAERGPNTMEYRLGGSDGLRITEWMYSGASGEFIEFTNLSAAPIDLSDWSMDDDHAVPGAFLLSSAGVLQPGESVVVTESKAEAFRSAWSLLPAVKIIGQLGTPTGNGLGRADQINLFNSAGELQDRLDYGDQTFVGSIRTQNRSGQAPCSAIGSNEVMSWQLSSVGDGFGSTAASSGDIGTPCRFDSSACAGAEALFADGFESP
jgi:hypothetical protein